MAIVTWPTSPSDGDTHDTGNGVTYIYNASIDTWKIDTSSAGGGGGVSTGPHADGSQTVYPVSVAEFAEINTPVTWTMPTDATHVYVSVFGRDQNESPSTISGIAIAAATGNLVATRSGTSFSVTVGGTTILTLNVASSAVSRPNNDTTVSPILATYIGTGSVNTNDNWWVTNIQWLST